MNSSCAWELKLGKKTVCSGRNPKTAALSEQRERKVLGRAGEEELFTTATVV